MWRHITVGATLADGTEAVAYVSADVIAVCVGDRVAIAHPRWLSRETGAELVRALLAVMPEPLPAEPASSCGALHPSAGELVCGMPARHQGDHVSFDTGMSWSA